METLTKLTYDLLELRYKMRSDDAVVTEQQMQSWIRQQRAIWVSNELNKGRFDQAYWQYIPPSALPVEEHPDLGSDYWATEVRIPRFTQVNHRTSLVQVNDGNQFTGVRYPLRPIQDIPYKGNGRFDDTVIYAYIMDNKIVLKRPVDDTAGDFDNITAIGVVGVFEDPMELKSYNKADATPVYWENEVYPIDLKLYTYMREQIVKINFPIEAQAEEDTINNATADA